MKINKVITNYWIPFVFGISMPLCSAPDAMANGYEECNQILTQDIFNKVTKNDSSIASSSAENAEKFFAMTESQAYEAYSKAYEEAKKNNTQIDAGGSYGIASVELGISLSTESKVSQSEFSQKFSSAKSARESSRSSKSSSAQNVVTTYASYVRDSGTVNAWKDCVTKTKETNLYAFASRDNAGKTYVNVMWVPGALAGSIPSIAIGFVTHGSDITIDAKPVEQIAMGSGRTFPVRCKKNCDEGFLVTVNGALKNAAGLPTSSFTSSVEVPPSVSKCINRKDYPLGRWRTGVIDATPAKYSNFVIFTTPTGGTWVPSSGPGEFEASVSPKPGASVTLRLQAHNGNYLSTNKLVVSDDGCRMEGTFSDNQGHSGGTLYTWIGGHN